MIARRKADMLAYVDGCMEASRRAAFEALMAAEPDIKRQIEEWRGQNEAIRAAFVRAAPIPAPGRASSSANENALPAWMPLPVRNLRAGAGARQGAPHLILARASQSSTSAPAEPKPRADRALVLRSATRAIGAAILCVALLATTGGLNSSSRPEATISSGLAVFRTYATGMVNPVEHATADVKDMRRWLATQIARDTPIPDLSSRGLTLLGGRIIPGARTPAAFLLYETSSHERVGLIIENLDAPAPVAITLRRLRGVETAFWTGSGHSFELVGRLSEERIEELARVAAGN